MRLKRLNNVKHNKLIKAEDLQPYLERVNANLPAQISAIQAMQEQVRGTAMQGLPFIIALLKSKLLDDKQIAEELRISIRAVRSYSQVPGFNDTVGRLMPAVWSDMQLQAWACLSFHMNEKNDKDTAKWILEHTGGVLTNQPMTTHQHLHLPGTQPQNGKMLQLPSNAIDMTADQLAGALMKRMDQTHLNQPVEPPKIRISVDEDQENQDHLTNDSST